MNAPNNQHPHDGATRFLFRNVAVMPAITLGALLLAGCATHPKSDTVKMDPAAMAILKAASDKLAAAKTVEVTTEHQLDPKLGLGLTIDEGEIQLAVKRPNQFHAIHPAGKETREISFDGHQLCVMHPGAKNYALETVDARSIEEFAILVDDRFGFRPPVAELLANDMAKELLFDVTSLQLLKKERVGGTECEHLRLEQEGMITDLWLAVDDKLPRRLLMTNMDIEGAPKWDIRILDWKLDQPIDEKLFSKRPAADSVNVKMTRSLQP